MDKLSKNEIEFYIWDELINSNSPNEFMTWLVNTFEFKQKEKGVCAHIHTYLAECSYGGLFCNDCGKQLTTEYIISPDCRMKRFGHWCVMCDFQDKCSIFKYYTNG